MTYVCVCVCVMWHQHYHTNSSRGLKNKKLKIPWPTTINFLVYPTTTVSFSSSFSYFIYFFFLLLYLHSIVFVFLLKKKKKSHCLLLCFCRCCLICLVQRFCCGEISVLLLSLFFWSIFLVHLLFRIVLSLRVYRRTVGIVIAKKKFFFAISCGSSTHYFLRTHVCALCVFCLQN